MVQITQIHLVGGTTHEHIQEVRWINPDTKSTGNSTRAAMVDYIDNKNGKAFVADARGSVWVRTVRPQDGDAYIQTIADGQYTDNLLALPRY